MRFRKIHGAGNDFILVSAEPADLHTDWSATAVSLCARRTGIGADGLIISARLDPDAPFYGVLCLNADGSTATMCGNALRCVARCAAGDSSVTSMRILMAGVEHQALVRDDGVWVTAEVGAVSPRRLQVVLNGRPTWFDSAFTGTEHVLAIVDDVDALDAEVFGRMVRRHPDLAPIGANVSFIQAAGSEELKIRTYERGVEAETLSCGSGAVAAVVVAALRGLVAGGRQVTVHNRSGSPLLVRPDSQHPGTVWVGGPVVPTYEGVLA